MDRGYDRFLTIFSPEGRLYQIEYAMQAVKKADITAVSVRGSDCVVVVCQKKLEDPRMDNKMLDFNSVTRMFSISPTVGACVIGSIADGKAVVSKARQEVADFQYKHGLPMSAYLLAKRMADLAQLNTQHAGRRTMGVDLLLASIDDEDGAQLYKVDPSGHFVGYKAIASGKLEQECNSLLEKKIGGDFDFEQALQIAVMTLQEAAKVDFNSKNLEVGVFRNGKKGSVFETLKTEEIEAALTKISERD